MSMVPPCPDCGCETECTLALDDFNRASLGADWNEAAGSATISSNKAQVSVANAQIINTTATSNAYMVKAKITAASGTRVRLIGSWADTSNYFWAEVLVDGSSSKILVGEVIAGVSTTKGESSTFTYSGSSATLRLCVASTGLIAMLNAPGLSNKSITGTASSALASGNAGIGTGSAVSGNVTFDDWHLTACGSCELETCVDCDEEEDQDGFFSRDLDIEFHTAFTFTPASGQHPLCTSGLNNQTFTLTPDSGAVECGSLGACPTGKWKYEGTLGASAPCSAMDFYIGAQMSGGSISVTIFFCTPPTCIGSSIARATFTGTYNRPMDCVNVEIPMEVGAVIGTCPDCVCGVNLFANPEATARI